MHLRNGTLIGSSDISLELAPSQSKVPFSLVTVLPCLRSVKHRQSPSTQQSLSGDLDPRGFGNLNVSAN